MGLTLPVDQMLAQLEAKAEHHRERQAFHAQQEIHHREQSAVHASELSATTERLEAFRAAAAAAGELLERPGAVAAQPAAKEKDEDKDAEEDLGKGRPLARMVARLLEEKGADEPFGSATLTREVNQRWGAKLRRKANPRTIAALLRRWARSGRIHRTREGRAYYESLYVREKPAGGADSEGGEHVGTLIQ